MKKTTVTSGLTNYKWVEKNISRIGPKTYRIRVGKHSEYAQTRQAARVIKRTLLSVA